MYYGKKWEQGKDNNDDEDATDLPPAKFKILRYKRYRFNEDPLNYYREQVLLFVPFRSKDGDINSCDVSSLYELNKNIIETNLSKYSIVADEVLDSGLQMVVQIKQPLLPQRGGVFS